VIRRFRHLFSRRRLGTALVVFGVIAGVAIVVAPVKATYAGDPLLRLQAFGSGSPPPSANPAADCGSPLANLSRSSDGLSLSTLAEDHACRNAASRRLATAVATAGVIGLLGAVSLAAAARSRAVPA
jgi:hypothetical protein